MPISKETVLRASRLAKLDLAAGAQGAEAEAEIERFVAQMGIIVEYMDIMNQADTSGVEPMYSPMGRTAPPAPDTPDETSAPRRDLMLHNAPEQADGLFVVPRIL